MRRPGQEEEGLIQERLDEVVASDGEIIEDVTLHHKGNLGIMGSVFNLVCTCVGAGILSLPKAMSSAGWIGSILMVFVSILSLSTAKLLVACMTIVPGKRLYTYEDIGEEVLGPKGRTLVSILQLATLFGVCTIFLILIGGNMNALVPSLTLHVWVFAAAAVLLPFAWLKTMGEIQFLAFFGVAASMVVGFLVVIKGFSTGPSPDTKFIIPEGLSTGFNIIVFSFGFHSVVPALANEMAQIKDFPTVANIGLSIITVVYTVVGAAGYYGWGAACGDNILTNMGHSVLVKIANGFITGHVLLAYPLPLNPVALACEAVTGISLMKGKKELVYRVCLRTALVFLTVFIASVVPYFGNILSLVSAFSLMGVALILPAFFYLKLHNRHGIDIMAPYYQAYLFFLMAIGLVGCAVGLYFSINDLVDTIKTHPNPFDHFFS